MLVLNERQEANLRKKIDITGFCWLWNGYLNSRGYGTFRVGSRNMRAHRVVFEWLVGTPPESLVANHLCKIRNCVNPDHIEFVTQKENVLYSYSPVRLNKDKTHCKRGHPLAGDNLKHKRDRYGVKRICITCSRAQNRKDMKKRRQRKLLDNTAKDV